MTKTTKKTKDGDKQPKTKSVNRIAGAGNAVKDTKASPKKPVKYEKAVLLKEMIEELDKKRKELQLSTYQWEIAHANAAMLKKEAEKKQGEFNEIAADVCNIQSGNYTPPLPGMGPENSKASKKNGKAETNGHVVGSAPAVDAGASQPLSSLLEFANPKTDVKYMTQSKVDLIKDVAGPTVGDLEKFQRENRDWVEKIKGLGEFCDRVNDSLIAFRRKFPVPDPILTASEKEKRSDVIGKQPADPNAPTAFDKADADGAGAKAATNEVDAK